MLVTYLIWLVLLGLIWRLVLLVNIVVDDIFTIVHLGIVDWLTVLDELKTIW